MYIHVTIWSCTHSIQNRWFDFWQKLTGLGRSIFLLCWPLCRYTVNLTCRRLHSSICLDTEGPLSFLHDICYVIEKLTHLSLLLFFFLVADLKLNLNLWAVEFIWSYVLIWNKLMDQLIVWVKKFVSDILGKLDVLFL